MEPDKPLTPKEIRVLEALGTEPTLKKAAQKAGIGYSTLRHWLKKRPHFQIALAEMSQKLQQQMWEEVSQHYRLPKR
jgi:hypothetical protein